MKRKYLFSILLPLIALFSLCASNQKVKAATFKNYDQFYAYDSVTTIDGTWGANLFINNDSNKQFDKILPKDSQWQIYGYTKRKDGFYYWAGGDQWIQANQARVPVGNESDAVLNVVAKFGEDDNPKTYWIPVHIFPEAKNGYRGGYWGTDYWWVRDAGPEFGSYRDSYIIYPDGNTTKLKIGDPTVG
ncbi:hypothetical protein FC83_GL000278 [Agrilactobacillus composti DSM 18527 = JCM 14202]|uniref:Surface layer protein A domain-containing protein n=1 Tax=Agrilactobacillus composti DSM 18527 = JCM 14202 TaxID=1423734 RepID=X0PIU3_9LACO|nr:hypothetical protein [Agrilactobacillus composti]KRM32713.1 hypothetical protein FC83_GL000278 [Agrilactobacillus composti DSM 18527 = JCM 14202]GAF42053.1 hypothetical protein JCM14202_4052 [Agrilactobacillus composti DSM 18527 = JCM 14202]